jgi:hypothetical protein
MYKRKGNKRDSYCQVIKTFVRTRSYLHCLTVVRWHSQMLNAHFIKETIATKQYHDSGDIHYQFPERSSMQRQL